MRGILACLVLLGWSITALRAQIRDQQQEKEPEPIRNFFAFGGHVLTRGWNVGLQYERAVPSGRHLFIATVSHIKDRAELRRESLFQAQQGTRFVMNKVHYLVPIHLGYGRSFTLIEKTKVSRSRLGAGFTLGPTLGVVVPYSVYRFVPLQGNPELGFREVATFYQDLQYEDVIGEVGFVQGARSASYQFGMTGTLHVQLDFGEKDEFIRAASLLFRADFFPGKVDIMRNDPRQVLLSGGVGLLLGNAW